MKNNIKTTFDIHDLELLSGIKAHTIRIWEKRYDFLDPERKSRQVRVYSIEHLKKMLNAKMLYENGYKISKIAAYTQEEIKEKCLEISRTKNSDEYSINTFIISMFTLDESLFNRAYNALSENRSFFDIYVSIFLPALDRVGVLWQLDSIRPAHEHFISVLIYQKIVKHLDALPQAPEEYDQVYVLFLPDGEIHELGLMFVNYHLRSIGKKTIFLGTSIPTDDLFEISSQFEKVVWITNYTLLRSLNEKKNFIKTLENLTACTENTCLIAGRGWEENEKLTIPKHLKTYSNIGSLIETEFL